MKFLSILSWFIGITAIVLLGLLKYSTDKEIDTLNARLMATRKALAETDEALSQSRIELEGNKKLMEEMDEALSASRTKATSLFQKQIQAEREIDSLSAQLTEVQEEAENSQATVEQLKRDLIEEKSRTPVISNQSDPLMVAQLKDKIGELEDKLAILQGLRPSHSSELDNRAAANVAPDAGELSGAVFQSNILGVTPDFSAAVLNLGSTHGMRTGFRLSLQRDGRALARVVLTEIRENLSVGRIENGIGNPDELYEGQSVVVVIQ